MVNIKSGNFLDLSGKMAKKGNDLNWPPLPGIWVRRPHVAFITLRLKHTNLELRDPFLFIITEQSSYE